MEVDCFKDMYQIAKKLKTMKIKSILENIVEQGFDASCQGYYNMNRIAALCFCWNEVVFNVIWRRK